MKFRQLILDVTEERIDPFQYITIDSVCMAVYKSLFLKEHYTVTFKTPEDPEVTVDFPAFQACGGRALSIFDGKAWVHESDLRKRGYSYVSETFVSSPIAQVPSEGYVKKDQYSKASIQWLEWVMHQSAQKGKPMIIQHALSGGEVSVSGTKYKLDGYCQASNTAYEYMGCLWHGCPKCFPLERKKTKSARTGQSMDELYALTTKKRQELKDLGFRYVEMWEHDFQDQLKNNPELSLFVSTLDLQERLDPRDSFFGGRTNATKLHYKTQDNEQVRYVDFTSLYPFVNSRCAYPSGHPEIIFKDFQPIQSYFGMAKLQILPPRKLYQPVLPYRSGGKLKFPLCRTCADTEQQSTCRHNEAQRAITGTWCTPEICMALEKGYTIISIYEVYHWDQKEEYNPATKEGGLFTNYIKTFLKLKQQASGWPDWCNTDEDKQKYLQDYFMKEGIRLDWDFIEHNPGLRSLAKLVLNSMWGKFGQRLNRKQTSFFTLQKLTSSMPL